MSELTADALRDEASRYMAAYGKEACECVLSAVLKAATRRDVRSIGQLKPTEYTAVMAAFRAAFETARSR